MKADDLVILLEVARAGTLVGAAQTLGINHTTVARRLQQLERDAGSPLLTSGPQGTYLTDRGKALLKPAERIERSLLEARSEGCRKGEVTGLVRVSSPEGFGIRFVAPAVAAVHARHPRLTVEVTTATRPLLQGSAADIEIGLARSSARRTGVLELTDYTLGLYASPDYLERRGTPTTAAELASHSLVYYVDGLVRVEDLAILHHQTIAVGSTSVYFQLEATRAGAGLGLLPRFLAHHSPGLVPVHVDGLEHRLTFVAALAPNQLRRRGAREVFRAIRAEVARRQDELLPDLSADKG